MSIAKVSTCGSLDPLKPEKKGQDFLDSIMRHVMGRDSPLSFSRANDNPVHWINLFQSIDQLGSSKVSNDLKANNFVERKGHSHVLHNDESTKNIEVKEHGHLMKHNKTLPKGNKSSPEEKQAFKLSEDVVAFAQAAARANKEPEKYLPGWPLLPSSNSKMQKCQKCAREFCSLINYRRHVRVHRRSLNMDKDSPRNREHLGAYWDKLSLSEAKQIASLEDAVIKDITGPSVVRALSSWMRKPGFSSLPKPYLKAGISLLDVVQASPSSTHLSSQELFSVLDDASEETFLCSGTAMISLQKFVFDGEVEKIGLEIENLIAYLSFMLEQKLIEAWLADKDAEALRCHKLLMEEEEAAQKRQAELLEKKRLKKLRQREQKRKDLVEEKNMISSSVTYDDIPDATGLPDTRGPGSESEMPEAPFLQNSFVGTTGSDHNGVPEQEIHLNTVQVTTGTNHGDKQMEINRREFVPTDGRLSKLLKTGSPVVCTSQIPSAKALATMSHSKKTTKVVTYATGHHIWTRKTKAKNEEKVLHGDHNYQNVNPDRDETSEVLIGSITVPLENNNCRDSISSPGSCLYQQKLVKPEARLQRDKLSSVKQWMPIKSLGNGASVADVSDRRRHVKEATFQNFATHNPVNEGTGVVKVISVKLDKDPLSEQATADLPMASLSSNNMVDALLAKRWMQAMEAEHVKLVLFLEDEASFGSDVHDIVHSEAQPCPSNRALQVVVQTTGNNRISSNTKFTANLDRSRKLKYVQKRRSNVAGE